ncbi:MAG: MBL fold metallo-hydrolase [Woeseiaceae bacterium]|tara:strand:+ start:114 stop:944 length:831 start_codon:yes stop_codon:yes gene_type:complete
MNLSSTANAQSFSDVEMIVHPVNKNVSYIEGRGGNIGVIYGEDGILLIDDQYAPLTEKIIEVISNFSSEPIRFIINTHMHPDHTGGNENFGKRGALIVGHENVRSQMKVAGYDQTPPFVTFSKDVNFHINDENIHVFKVPNAHTNNDSFIKFTNANVIHTGDVFRSESYPYIDANNGGSFLGTIEVYELLISLCDENTKIIPGHGKQTTVETVKLAIEMLQEIKSRIELMIMEGKDLDEILRSDISVDYDNRWDSGRRIGGARGMISVAFSELVKL